jgi:hypothetical protein
VSLTHNFGTGRACRDSCNPALKQATELTRSLTGQIAKKVLDDLAARQKDQMGAKSRSSLFLPQPGITPGKGTINL